MCSILRYYIMFYINDISFIVLEKEIIFFFGEGKFECNRFLFF